MIEAATVSELREKKRKLIEINGKKIALFFISGEVFAVDSVCPHRGGPLDEGELNEYDIICPWHGFTYDLKDGNCIKS